jgi:hypothetical protein
MGKGHSMPCTTSATNDKPNVVVAKQLPESPATKDATALLGMGGVMNTVDDTFYEPGERETFTSMRDPGDLEQTMIKDYFTGVNDPQMMDDSIAMVSVSSAPSYQTPQS